MICFPFFSPIERNISYYTKTQKVKFGKTKFNITQGLGVDNIVLIIFSLSFFDLFLKLSIFFNVLSSDDFVATF